VVLEITKESWRTTEIAYFIRNACKTAKDETEYEDAIGDHLNNGGLLWSSLVFFGLL
jgi:hypothetical protein